MPATLMRKSGWRVFVGALMVLVAQTAAAAGGFTVGQVMADLNLPADAAARLRHGEILHSDPQESSDRELGVGLTFLVQRPPAEVLKVFRTVVDLKADPHLSASVEIRGPGTHADFASLVLEPGAYRGKAPAPRYDEFHAAKLAALVPRPRLPLIRFHAVFAPEARPREGPAWRAEDAAPSCVPRSFRACRPTPIPPQRTSAQGLNRSESGYAPVQNEKARNLPPRLTPISRHLPIFQQSCFGAASSLQQTPTLAKA
jgi:hypothetical protein